MVLEWESSLEAARALRVATPSIGVWGCGCHRGSPVRLNSRSAEFHASVVLNHSCYVVLGLNWR